MTDLIFFLILFQGFVHVVHVLYKLPKFLAYFTQITEYIEIYIFHDFIAQLLSIAKHGVGRQLSEKETETPK